LGLLIARSQHAPVPLWAPLVALPFAVVMVSSMGRIQRRRTELRRLREFYQAALARLEDKWRGRGFAGEEFREEDHPFADDLDLFGEGSLFELLAVTRTGIGRATLADWMKAPAARGEVLARQEAVAELRDHLQLREAVQLAGAHSFSPCEKAIFSQWLESPPLPFPAWFRFAAGVLPLVWSGAAIAFALGFVSKGMGVAAALAALAAEGALAWRCRRSVRTVLGGIGTPAIDLKIIRNLFKLMLNCNFASPKLKQLAGALHTPDALGEVGRLERLVWFLEWRQVDVFSAVFWALLWGTQFGMAIERWRSRHGASFGRWLSAIGEFEALKALACYSFEHPHDPFPVLTEGIPLFDAGRMGHPLLDESACQRNDVRLAQEHRLLIVSGSNMSGKSTLLRSAGVNVVLALMGAPVRASHMTMSNLRISASIRVQDSLLRGRSHFYAEVSKIRDSISRAESSPVLFLIDEILSGTNSRDRRIAAEAVIRALIARNAIGMITTHDLALTQIALIREPCAENVHFSDQADSGGLEFDYRLRPGVLKESNALALIRTLGISV
jgi:MutS domain V